MEATWSRRRVGHIALQRATVTRGLATGPERFEGRSRYSSLSAAEEGPAAIILKGPVQFIESFSLRTSLSAPFSKPWWKVAAVL